MTSEPYLLQLAARLAAGRAAIPPENAARHAAFVRSRRTSEGGFRGRDEEADLYYTSFAVRALHLLGEFGADDARTVAGYLETFDPTSLGVIDQTNWLVSALSVEIAGVPSLIDDPVRLSDAVVETLTRTRTADGGFAKSPEGAAGSMYATFLAVLAHQLVGREVADGDGVLRFVRERQRDDGGFVEIAPMRRSGTNPTAAAAALLRILDRPNAVHPDDLADFLRDVRTEGGLAANTRVPLPDGLSTFTGLLTAQDWGLDVLGPAAVRGFVREQLEVPTGGFRAAAWDDAADVEYTFYGLGCLVLAEELGSC